MHLFCLIEITAEIRRQYHRIIFKHNISKKHTRYFNITMCLSNASNRPAFQSGPRVSCWILYPFQQCSKQCEPKCHVLEGHIYHNHITFYTQRQFPSVVKEQQTQLRVCLEKWKIASLSSQYTQMASLVSRMFELSVDKTRANKCIHKRQKSLKLFLNMETKLRRETAFIVSQKQNFKIVNAN